MPAQNVYCVAYQGQRSRIPSQCILRIASHHFRGDVSIGRWYRAYTTAVIDGTLVNGGPIDVPMGVSSGGGAHSLAPVNARSAACSCERPFRTSLILGAVHIVDPFLTRFGSLEGTSEVLCLVRNLYSVELSLCSRCRRVDYRMSG
jgi:hypothetical protein